MCYWLKLYLRPPIFSRVFINTYKKVTARPDGYLWLHACLFVYYKILWTREVLLLYFVGRVRFPIANFNTRINLRRFHERFNIRPFDCCKNRISYSPKPSSEPLHAGKTNLLIFTCAYVFVCILCVGVSKTILIFYYNGRRPHVSFTRYYY